MEQIIKRSIEEHRVALGFVEKNQETIAKIAAICVESLEAGGKIIFMGNGGSAADAQHLAAELVGRFKKERRALSALALTTDTSILTAVANDYTFDNIFVRQIEALCRPQDTVFGISTSGRSKNLVKATIAARQIGAHTVGLLGKDGGDLLKHVEIAILIPGETPRIQEMHALVGHTICEIIENSIG